MNSHIEWTATAQQSLENVFEYTYGEFGERQLRKLHSQILKTVRRIAQFPQTGAVESFSSLLEKEYRSAKVIKEIKVIYSIIPEGIRIEYIKNSRLDEETLLDALLIKHD
ncbi:MAG: type II toxin-antitoxin system RelE/ParE family toxin [Prevotella sp.]|nr:type II toxin-antitoxin system RelE/ParE family toxin [Prevotella sp.]